MDFFEELAAPLATCDTWALHNMVVRFIVAWAGWATRRMMGVIAMCDMSRWCDQMDVFHKSVVICFEVAHELFIG